MRAIIKATNACNLDCTYCGAWRQAEGTISFQTLLRIYEYLASHTGDAPIIAYWHGGEPLLAGLDFYRKAVELQEYFMPTLFKNHIITNLTLCNQKWAEFLAENKFFVATSIDGPQHIHDRNRQHFDKRGTYVEVCQCINVLRESGATIGSAIATLQKDNIRHIKEIYETYRTLKLNLTLGYMTPSGQKACHPLVISEADYYEALRSLMEIWLVDPDPIEINLFEAIIEGLIRPGSGKSCLEDIVGFDADGKIYPCHATVGHPSFVLGTISSDHDLVSIESALKKAKNTTYELIDHCRSCEVFGICDGLCPYNNLILYGDPAHKPMDCGVRKDFFLWAKEQLSPFLVGYMNTDERQG